MFSFSQPKKPLKPIYQTQNMSVNPQMSVAPKQSSGGVRQTNPITNTFTSMSQGKGFSSLFPSQAVTTSARIASKPAAPIQSVAQKPSTPQTIQGSGTTSQYASNPTNYVAKPPVQDTAAAPKPTFDSITDNYVQGQQERGQQRADLAYKMYEDEVANRQKLAELKNQQLTTQQSDARADLDAYNLEADANIAALLESGKRQKEAQEESTGRSLRQSAKAKREADAKRQRIFAALGTLESTGSMGFTGVQSEADADFARGQQEMFAQRDRVFAEIDDKVGTAERQIILGKNAELRKFQTLVRQIDMTMAQGSVEHEAAMNKAYNEYQSKVMALDDAFSQIKYAADSQKLKFAQDNMGSQLSEQFMSTGVPQTMADYMYIQKDPKAAEYIKSAVGSGATSSGQKASKIIEDLLKLNTEGITGRMRNAFSDESRSAEGLIKQLSSELQIEEAKRLKGQGAMSDSERAILANSIAAFNLDKNGKPQVSDTRFREILNELQTGFSGQPTAQTGALDPAVQAYLQANGLM